MKKFLIILLVFLPVSTFAQIVISEVMYSLDGADDGREWIEVQNTGSIDIDFSMWKFRENNSNHGLTLTQGNQNILAGGYAIVADDPSKFLTDWPNFSGTIFDSSFSLSNTGEALVLRDSTLTDKDTISYSSDLGGQGDGNSLHRSGQSFFPGAPTPGGPPSGNVIAPSTPQPSSSSNSSAGSSSSSSSSSQTPATSEAEQNDSFQVEAGKDRLTTVGSTVVLRGEIKGTQKKQGGTYTWSLGDGSIKYGQEIVYNYRFPGDYVAVLNFSNSEERATDRVNIKVVEPELRASVSQDGLIIIENLSSSEINLQDWKILVNNKSFVFPRDTILKGGAKLILAKDVIGFDGNSWSHVRIFYPLGAEYISKKQTSMPSAPTVAPLAKTKTESNVAVKAELEEISQKKDEIEKLETEIAEENQVAAVSNTYVVEKPKGFWKKIMEFFTRVFK